MSAESFVTLCLRGELLTEEIDDWVERWHQSDSELTLAQFLGMTDEEYNAWLLDDTVLPFILKARKDDVPLETSLEQGIERIAARNQSSREVMQVLSWLNKHAV